MASAGKALPNRSTRYDRALRLVVALPLGYILSGLGGICLAFCLPFTKADSAVAGIFLGLLLWPVVFVASFGFANIRRLALSVIVLALCLTALAVSGGWRP